MVTWISSLYTSRIRIYGRRRKLLRSFCGIGSLLAWIIFRLKAHIGGKVKLKRAKRLFLWWKLGNPIGPRWRKPSRLYTRMRHPALWSSMSRPTNPTLIGYRRKRNKKNPSRQSVYNGSGARSAVWRGSGRTSVPTGGAKSFACISPWFRDWVPSEAHRIGYTRSWAAPQSHQSGCRSDERYLHRDRVRIHRSHEWAHAGQRIVWNRHSAHDAKRFPCPTSIHFDETSRLDRFPSGYSFENSSRNIAVGANQLEGERFTNSAL